MKQITITKTARRQERQDLDLRTPSGRQLPY
jgi:hypothetical protein